MRAERHLERPAVGDQALERLWLDPLSSVRSFWEFFLPTTMGKGGTEGEGKAPHPQPSHPQAPRG